MNFLKIKIFKIYILQALIHLDFKELLFLNNLIFMTVPLRLTSSKILKQKPKPCAIKIVTAYIYNGNIYIEKMGSCMAWQRGVMFMQCRINFIPVL